MEYKKQTIKFKFQNNMSQYTTLIIHSLKNIKQMDFRFNIWRNTIFSYEEE